MINEHQVKRYCSGDISLIENYNLAVSSPERWVCHHRRGFGEMTTDELKRRGLYLKRPPDELVFMPLSEHKSMHSSGGRHYLYGRRQSEESNEKNRRAHLGKRHTEAEIEKIRRASLGTRWYTDGERNIRTKEGCPRGFRPGKTHRRPLTRASREASESAPSRPLGSSGST